MATPLIVDAIFAISRHFFFQLRRHTYAPPISPPPPLFSFSLPIFSPRCHYYAIAGQLDADAAPRRRFRHNMLSWYWCAPGWPAASWYFRRYFHYARHYACHDYCCWLLPLPLFSLTAIAPCPYAIDRFSPLHWYIFIAFHYYAFIHFSIFIRLR